MLLKIPYDFAPLHLFETIVFVFATVFSEALLWYETRERAQSNKYETAYWFSAAHYQTRALAPGSLDITSVQSLPFKHFISFETPTKSTRSSNVVPFVLVDSEPDSRDEQGKFPHWCQLQHGGGGVSGPGSELFSDLFQSSSRIVIIRVGFKCCFNRLFTFAGGFLSSQRDQRDQGKANSFQYKESQRASFKVPKRQMFKILKWNQQISANRTL